MQVFTLLLACLVTLRLTLNFRLVWKLLSRRRVPNSVRSRARRGSIHWSWIDEVRSSGLHWRLGSDASYWGLCVRLRLHCEHHRVWRRPSVCGRQEGMMAMALVACASRLHDRFSVQGVFDEFECLFGCSPFLHPSPACYCRDGFSWRRTCRSFGRMVRSAAPMVQPIRGTPRLYQAACGWGPPCGMRLKAAQSAQISLVQSC